MIERQVEAPVLPGDDDGGLPLVGEVEPGPEAGVYIEPGGLVEIAVNELGGQVTSVERLPDAEP